MKGTITWLEATEENINQIPLNNGISSWLIIANDKTFELARYYKSQNGFKCDLTPRTITATHFAYINNPE